VSPRRVGWRCLEGPQEWVGTELTFDLTAEQGETAVSFRHAGWRSTGEFMGHCSTKWGFFLIGLKLAMEGTAPSVAYPNDLALCGWEEQRTPPHNV
jgi:hypothetical protein